MNNKRKRALVFTLLAAGGGLLIFAALIAAQNPGQATPTAPGSGVATEETYPEVERVTLDEARAAYDSRSAVFVDVRSYELYTLAHIPGAVSMPVLEVADRMGELDPNQWIITYCT